jgi:hypothetical protein
VAPAGNSKPINDGSIERICPQGYGEWFVDSFAPSVGLKPDQLEQLLVGDPRVTTDCLFLDVFVPQSVFDARKKIDCADKGGEY